MCVCVCVCRTGFLIICPIDPLTSKARICFLLPKLLAAYYRIGLTVCTLPGPCDGTPCEDMRESGRSQVKVGDMRQVL